MSGRGKFRHLKNHRDYRPKTVSVRKSSGLRRVKPEPRFRIPPVIDITVRWALVFVLISVLTGSIATNIRAREMSRNISLEESDLRAERDILRGRLEHMSDPEWIEAYWKWRTMRRDPYHKFIDFKESPGHQGGN